MGTPKYIGTIFSNYRNNTDEFVLLLTGDFGGSVSIYDAGNNEIAVYNGSLQTSATAYPYWQLLGAVVNKVIIPPGGHVNWVGSNGALAIQGTLEDLRGYI